MKLLSQNNSLSEQLMTPPRHQGRNLFIPSHRCGVQTKKSLGPNSPSARAAACFANHLALLEKGCCAKKLNRTCVNISCITKTWRGCPFTFPFLSLLSSLA